MADWTKTVDPGGTGDYTSLNAAIVAAGAGDDIFLTCISSNGSDDTTMATIEGSNSFVITGGDFPVDGVLDLTKYVVRVATVDYTRGIKVFQNNVTIKNIQVNASVGAASTSEIGIQVYPGSNGTILIDGCILKGSGQSAANVTGIAANWSCNIRNTLIYGFEDYGIDTNDWNSAVLNIYHCTITGANRGIAEQANGTVNVYNSALFNNTDDFFGTPTVISYCASDQGAGENTDGHGVDISGTWDSTCFTDTNGLGPDWSIQDAESPLYNTGVDLSASGVTDDIIGTARPQSTAYDIGAFELIVAAGGLSLLLVDFLGGDCSRMGNMR